MCMCVFGGHVLIIGVLKGTCIWYIVIANNLLIGHLT